MLINPTPGKSEWVSGALPFRFGVTLLLLLYIAVFVYSPVGVPHVHHEDKIHSGDACLMDACHISIFHPGVKGGCKHKFHFTKAGDDCDLCKVVLPRQVNADAFPFVDMACEFMFAMIPCVNEESTATVLHHADRGPPTKAG